MATKTDWATELENLCRTLAEEAFKRYGRNVSNRLYLVGDLDDADCFYNLRIANDTEHSEWNATLVTGDYIPCNYTLDRMAGWMRDALRRTPLALIRNSY